MIPPRAHLFAGLALAGAIACAAPLRAADDADGARARALSRLLEDAGATVVPVEVERPEKVPCREGFWFSRSGKRVAIRTLRLERRIGCGLVLNDSGNLLVPSDLVEGARAVWVLDADGSRTEAEVVGASRFSRVALLRSSGLHGRLPVFPDSVSPEPGSLVAVLGNAYGAAPSTAFGLYTGRAQVPSVLETFPLLRIATSLHPGDCGGTVLSEMGGLLGIVLGIGGAADADGDPGATASPVAYAIPINEAQLSAARIMQASVGPPGFLGVTVGPSEDGGADVVVYRILVGGPAERAGLRPGDVITHFAGWPVRHPWELQEVAASLRPQDIASVTWRREDEGSLTGVVRLVEAVPPSSGTWRELAARSLPSIPEPGAAGWDEPAGGARMRREPDAGAATRAELREEIRALEERLSHLKRALDTTSEGSEPASSEAPPR